MARWLFALLAAVMVSGLALAEDKKVETKEDKKEGPTGVWTKELENGAELRFDFTKKDQLTITIAAGDAGLVIVSKLTQEKDGSYKGKATKIEKKGEFPVDIKNDYEFGFKLKIDGKTAKVTDYTANDHEDEGKHAVEGDYKKAEDK